MGTQIVIPHHYDLTEGLFRKIPDAMKDMSLENQERFIENGIFQTERYMEAFGKAVQEKSPSTDLMLLEHHRWYPFQFRLSEA